MKTWERYETLVTLFTSMVHERTVKRSTRIESNMYEYRDFPMQFHIFSSLTRTASSITLEEVPYIKRDNIDIFWHSQNSFYYTFITNIINHRSNKIDLAYFNERPMCANKIIQLYFFSLSFFFSIFFLFLFCCFFFFFHFWKGSYRVTSEPSSKIF